MKSGIGRRLRQRLPIIAIVLFHKWIIGPSGFAQGNVPEPKTRPERTEYTETSRYEDVLAFLRSVTAFSSCIHLTGADTHRRMGGNRTGGARRHTACPP